MTEWKDYCVTYPYHGAQWGLTIRATTHEDAELRLKALAWAKIDGELVLIVPASIGWWVPFFTWFQNLFTNYPPKVK